MSLISQQAPGCRHEDIGRDHYVPKQPVAKVSPVLSSFMEARMIKVMTADTRAKTNTTHSFSATKISASEEAENFRCSIVETLRARGPLRLGEIARHMKVAPQDIANYMKAMIRHGRIGTVGDNRTKKIYCIPEASA